MNLKLLLSLIFISFLFLSLVSAQNITSSYTNFTLSNDSNAEEEPVIAYNSTEGKLLSIWKDESPTINDLYNIRGQFISTSGSLSGNSFAVIEDQNNKKNLDIDFDSINNRFAVVYIDQNTNDSLESIKGVIVDSNSEVGSPFTLKGTQATNYYINPKLKFDSSSNKFIFSFGDGRTGTMEAFIQLMDLNGELIDTDLNVFSYPLGNVINGAKIEFNSENNSYYAFQTSSKGSNDQNVIARKFNTSGGAINFTSDVITVSDSSTATKQELFMSPNSGTGETFFIWSDPRTSANLELYGQIMNSSLSNDLNNFKLVQGTRRRAQGIEFLSALDKFVVFYKNRIVNTGGFDYWDLNAQLFNTDGNSYQDAIVLDANQRDLDFAKESLFSVNPKLMIVYKKRIAGSGLESDVYGVFLNFILSREVSGGKPLKKDLIVEEISTLDFEGNETQIFDLNELIKVKAKIKNNGTEKISQNFKVALNDPESEKIFAEKLIDLNGADLNAGQAIEAEFEFARQKPGLFRFIAAADSENNIEELGAETNNEKIYAVLIREFETPKQETLPDLTLTELTAVKEINFGEKALIKFKAKNIGDKDSESFKVTLFNESFLTPGIQEQLIEGLKANEEKELSFEIDSSSLLSGMNKFFILADSGKEINEKLEENNLEFFSLNVNLLELTITTNALDLFQGEQICVNVWSEEGAKINNAEILISGPETIKLATKENELNCAQLNVPGRYSVRASKEGFDVEAKTILVKPSPKEKPFEQIEEIEEAKNPLQQFIELILGFFSGFFQ